MAHINQAAFAHLHGVSRKTVTKWKERGWLVFQGDLVDAEASNELLRKYRRDGAETVTRVVTSSDEGNKQGNKAGAAPGNKKAVTNPPDADETNEELAARLARSEYADWTFDEARRVKETYLALLNQLEYEQKEGSLVELETVRQVFFEIFRAQRDAWLNWPTRVGPLVAADLGLEADKVTEILTAHVHKHIRQLGEPEPNFAGEG